MTTFEGVSADIKQILDAFDSFVNMYELDNWLRSVTVEEIKSSFKLAGFVEETIKNLQTKQCLEPFLNVLKLWWKTNKNRTKIYNTVFFSRASDNLLSKFFTNQSIKVNTADIAIRIYTTLYPKERFENFLSNLILESSSYEAIIDYTTTVHDSLDLKELQCRLLLRNWSDEAESGRISDVKAVITNMVSNYKIEATLTTVINILALKNVSCHETFIKEIILQSLFSRMADRSILSKPFWLSLFRHVERKQLAAVCSENESLLKELFDFIIYLGCMMNLEMHNSEMKWVGDPLSSICPDLTYDDLVGVIKCLCSYSPELRKYAEFRIFEAVSSTGSSQLWQQVRRDI